MQVVMAEHRSLGLEEVGLAVEQVLEQVSSALVLDPKLGSGAQRGAEIVSGRLSETVELSEGAEVDRLHRQHGCSDLSVGRSRFVVIEPSAKLSPLQSLYVLQKQVPPRPGAARRVDRQDRGCRSAGRSSKLGDRRGPLVVDRTCVVRRGCFEHESSRRRSDCQLQHRVVGTRSEHFDVADPAALPEMLPHLAAGEVGQCWIDWHHRRLLDRGVLVTTGIHAHQLPS
jgi:hypothetical protein